MSMTAFRGGPAPTKAQKPLREKVLPPSAFADTWKGRPREPVRIGIRLVGHDIVDVAEQTAAEDVAHLSPGKDGSDERRIWIDAYNTAFMRGVLAQALCSPDDVDRPYFADAPNDRVRVAFPPRTLRALWEEFEALSVETSPTMPEATDEEIAGLAGMLAMPSPLSGIAPDPQRRLRRLVARLRAELIDAFPEG